jgi:hypothetical protein
MKESRLHELYIYNDNDIIDEEGTVVPTRTILYTL